MERWRPNHASWFTHASGFTALTTLQEYDTFWSRESFGDVWSKIMPALNSISEVFSLWNVLLLLLLLFVLPLPNGALWVQMYATRSTSNIATCFGERFFTRLQGRETYRRFPKVSELYRSRQCANGIRIISDRSRSGLTEWRRSIISWCG